MATATVLNPSPRPNGSYARKRRHSVSAPPPGFQLPFPHAPKPVSPLLTPSAVIATGVTPRRRVSTAPLSPSSRPATIGHALGSRASMQRRLATYGEQGVAASSLATLEASCAASNGPDHVIKQVTLDENSPLRKKQRSTVPGDVSSSDAKPGVWNVRTFPFHRVRPGADSPRRRLGIPSFGWPKPTSASLASMTSDTPMEDGEIVVEPIIQPCNLADLSSTGKASHEETPVQRAPRLFSDAASSNNDPPENPRQGSLRCRSTSPNATPRPIPRPITKMSRRKSQSPPPKSIPPPRLSSPLGPERHVLPPRPQFPRSMNSRAANELRFGKGGVRIPSLGERGSGPDMYRRVLLRKAHAGTRKREMARLAKLAAQADEEEVYVLRISEDVKGCVMMVTETNPPSSLSESKSQEELNENMDVDAPECGDIELLPDIPDMDFEDENPRQITIA
jgi:hypothetical protein